jgi:hypothetical protein
VAGISDKLKFVGHFKRPFALLSNSPTVSIQPNAHQKSQRSKDKKRGGLFDFQRLLNTPSLYR